jgi:hypothetical protein
LTRAPRAVRALDARRGALATGLLVVASMACSYDVDRLRPPDGGVRDVDPIDGDVDPGDAATTCTSRSAMDPLAIGRRIGPSIVLAGDTFTSPTSTLTPPAVAGSDCNPGTSTEVAPEWVYRYVVERGPTLYATTDAPSCEGVYDSILYVRTTCEQTTGRALACSDDDHVLSGCACAMPTMCPGLASGVMATGLTAGQVVYVVVDGFAGRAGRFRLVLTENAAANAPPPTTAPGGVADRCHCHDPSVDTEVATVPFPNETDAASGAMAPLLVNPNDAVVGSRRSPFSRIAGVALEMTLRRIVTTGDGGCAAARATFDLTIGDRVMHSFAVTASTVTMQPMRVAFQTFAPVTLSTSVDLPIAVRLRDVTPAGCLGVEIDRTQPGTLTLLGRR